MKTRKNLVLTEAEAIAIAECLESLEAMSGAFDEHFTREAKRAGRLAIKIRNTIYKK